MYVNDKKFTAKQAAFIKEFQVDMNGNQAAIRAGYSAHTANEMASKLLAKGKVADEVKRQLNERAAKTDISIERILLEYKRLALLDIRKAFDENGNLKPIHEIDDDTAAALAAIESEELWNGKGDGRTQVGNLKKIKFADKRAALSDLMRHLGGFEKDNAQQGANAAALLAALAQSKTTEEKSKVLKSILNP